MSNNIQNTTPQRLARLSPGLSLGVTLTLIVFAGFVTEARADDWAFQLNSRDDFGVPFYGGIPYYILPVPPISPLLVVPAPPVPRYAVRVPKRRPHYVGPARPHHHGHKRGHNHR